MVYIYVCVYICFVYYQVTLLTFKSSEEHVCGTNMLHRLTVILLTFEGGEEHVCNTWCAFMNSQEHLMLPLLYPQVTLLTFLVGEDHVCAILSVPSWTRKGILYFRFRIPCVDGGHL